MSTSLRFRSRQGERNVESSSAQRWQSLIDTWGRYIRNLWSGYAAHLILILVVILVFSTASLRLPIQYDFALPVTPTAVPALGIRTAQDPVSGRGGPREPLAQRIPTSTPPIVRPLPARLNELMTADLLQAPVVHTTIPHRLRRDVITYAVQKGDTVLGIAAAFDVEQETLMWANANVENNPDLLRPGQELIILPIDGVYHTVVKGDTLEKIAKQYKASLQDIIDCPYNNLDPEAPVIAPGDKIIVPGGIKPYVAKYVSAYSGPIPQDAQRGSGIFSWPTSGYLTDRFGFATASGRWHGGLDISSYRGAPVLSADSGFVTFAGWTSGGYGNLVIIDHRNGFETRYAHLSVIYVSAGQSVTKGMTIAAVGTTGNSTGPHLHFEVREKGVRKNPLLYLP
jgi:murein DD-endopeptidase MepM/ murein hydrolase activator NlpD